MDQTPCIAWGLFLCYNIKVKASLPMTAASPFGGFRLGGDRKPSLYNFSMKKTEDITLHPLWFGPVLLLFTAILIQTLHTLTHWHMEIDADAWCRNNAEWVESNENPDY